MLHLLLQGCRSRRGRSRSSHTPEVSSSQGLEGDSNAGLPVSEPAPFAAAMTLKGVFDSVSTCSLSGPAHKTITSVKAGTCLAVGASPPPMTGTHQISVER